MNHMPSDCRRPAKATWALSFTLARLGQLSRLSLCLGLIAGFAAFAYPQDITEPGAAPAETAPQNNADPDLQGSYSRSIIFLREREMEARLRGAQTAFTLGRSVDGVQILAELLALPEPHFIQVSSSLRDVRDEAAALLRNGPNELREQFRRQTEVRAAEELKNALGDGDISAVATVAARYPFTPVARESVEILVSQFYDHGRYDAVIQAASRWLERSPDPGLAVNQSSQMFALWRQALIEVGAAEQADQLVSRFVTPANPSPAPPQRTVDGLLPESRSPSELVAGWKISTELPEPVRDMLGTVLDNLSRQGIHPSLAMRPLVLQQHIVWRSLNELICVNRTTGEVLWRQPIEDPTARSIVQMGETKADGNRIVSLRSQLGHRVLRNSILSQITSDGERVYTVEYSSVVRATPAPPTQPQPNNLPPESDRMPIPEMTLVAYSLADGTVVWRSDEVWQPDQSLNTFFFGPPVVHGKSLYAVIQNQEQLRILRMDPATGTLDGASLLGEAPHLSDDRRRMSEACPIVWHNGVAICATGAGGVAAFDIYRGQLQWGFRHRRNDVVISQVLLMPPVDKSGWTWMSGWEQPQLFPVGTNVIYGSPETDLLRCLDISNGELKWEVPIAGARAVVGGDDERVVLKGVNVVRALRCSDGSVERELVTPEQIVSATWLGVVCRLELQNGQQIDWTPQTGKTVVSRVESVHSPMLYAAGTSHRIHGEAEQALVRSLPVGDHVLVARVDGLSLRPASSDASGTPASGRVPQELVWKSGQTQSWQTAVSAWVEAAPAEEKAARVAVAMVEIANALESNEPVQLPVDEWATSWALTPEQLREVTFRSLQNAMQAGDNHSALRHVLRLLEQQPDEWETELTHARWGRFEVGAEAATARTVRLDAALRGALQELWAGTPVEQRSSLETIYREWAGRERTVLDELAQPLEQLSFLPPPAKERPLQWKTLGELARQQLSLRHLSTHENRTTAAAALWRLVELHMARGEWGNAAGLIEQLKRQFASVTVRGNQTADELIKQLPENSLVLKSIDRDRRTTWPEREPVVSVIESSREPESQQPIPVRSERGSIFDHLNLTYAARQLQFSGLGKVHRSWALSLPGGRRNLWQQYSAIKAGWAFGQFVVVQFGSELYCLSSLDAKGEAKTSKIREVVLWPAMKKNAPPSPIDTLGNEDNEFTYESRPIPQVVGFVRREIEPFDSHGHRAAWVGPVSAGTLCFLQQGMLVGLDTATGQELWRRYDVPAGARTFGDDSVVVLLRDGSRTVELLSPVDGHTVANYESEYTADKWVRTWGRNALIAIGQPAARQAIQPLSPAPPGDADPSSATAQPTTPPSTPPTSQAPVPPASELRLRMVDLSGPRTLWERTFPAGSAAFEVDEDWLGVISRDGTLRFLDVQTGQLVRESKVAVPEGFTQIVTAVTERSIFVTLSPPVTENALVGSKPVKLKSRQFYVNGPVHAFDRLSGEYQWSQQIENRVFPIDQVRDIPLLICADTWKGPLDPLPEVGEVFPKLEGPVQKADDPNALRVRYWAVDTRTGRVVLDTAIEKSMVQYTVERNLAEGWVEIRLGRTGFRFSYQDEEKAAK